MNEQDRDIRMRVWIPYSLKSGLDCGRDVVCCDLETREKLNEGWQWVEFVAVNDPLAEDEPKPAKDCKGRGHIAPPQEE